MNERQERLRSHLDKLVSEPGLLGAALVSRDGIHVLDAFKRPFHPETFSAMSATLLGAAEVALGELGGRSLRRVLADADNLRMLVIGVSGDLLLVTLSEVTLGPERLLPLVEATAEHVASELAG